jgi:beta-glucosidase
LFASGGCDSLGLMNFPKDFVWGSATASYQIEGAALEDGKGLSVWDVFSRQPGKTWQGETGEVACDHYHLYKEDVALMKAIGLQAYRFSVSWPRVMPSGTGAVNAKGLDFYDRLIDELLAAGIQPWLTLFHWDYPHDLFLRGGWLNPESPKWFADYTEVVVKKLSDRVGHWMTLNEPQCFIGLGHDQGCHAPGLKLSRAECLLAAHHVLLAHGLGVQAIRAFSEQEAQVGWAPVGLAGVPASDSAEDLEALKQHVFRAGKGFLWNNSWWGDPVVLGHYPEVGLREFGRDVPKYTDSEMRTIRQPIDFYGANIYGSPLIKATPDGNYIEVPYPEGFPRTHYYWEMTPESLYWGPRLLYERYKLPIVVTENGMSNADWVSLDGKVHDPQRIDLVHRYLLQLDRAMAEGVDVRGYFLWSTLDNFEWAEAYKQRFGLIHVDYATRKRTPKDSALWYADVIRSNGGSLKR